MTTQGGGRRLLAVLTVLASLGAMAVAAPASASGFTISGTVRSQASGTPVYDVCVDVRDASSGQQVGTATSTDTGTYSVSGIPAGSYHVFFDPQCFSLSVPYTWQWWSGTTDPSKAGTIIVQTDVPLVDASLGPGGSLAGTLTDPHGQPAAGVCVSVDDPARSYYARPTWQTTSDTSGHYSFDGLATAAYEVSYGWCDNTWSTEYYPGVDFQHEQLVAVTAPAATTGVNATVARLTTISGRLTWTTDGSPVAYTCVEAFETGGGLHIVPTAADGTFIMTGVSRGTYTIVFASSGCATNPPIPDVATTVYSATGDRTKATSVSVDGDPITGIDMALPPAADISGHITGPDGQPLSGVTVRAWAHGPTDDGSDARAYGYWTAQSDASGNYTVLGLPTIVDVRVEVVDLSHRYPDYWYRDQTTESAATQLSTSTGHVISGVDAQLHNGSELEGHVYDSVGAPVSGAVVHVLSSSLPSGQAAPTATTDSSGAWFIDGLQTGTYRAWAEAPSRPDTAARYLPSAADPAQATAIPLAAGAVLSGQDIHLGAAAHIAGTVDNSSGIALANVCVTARDPRRRAFVGTSGTATSDGNGRYDVGGLNAGTYVVDLTPCPGLLAGSVFHGGAVVQSAATRVNVTTGATTDVGADRLPSGGDVTGTVTSSGAPLGSYVTAESDSGALRTVLTATDGSYRISGLTAGSWRIHFQSCPSAHSVYYSNSDSSSGATAVSVSGGTVTSGISVDLPRLSNSSSDSSCQLAYAPQSLTATAVDDTTVLLTWVRPPEAPTALTGYDIWASTPDGSYQFFAPPTLKSDDTETLVTGVSPGHYSFAVASVYGNHAGLNGTTSYSPTVDVGPPSSQDPPQVTMTSHPPAKTSSTSAAFEFSVSDPFGSGTPSVACMLDGVSRACTAGSLLQVNNLTAGSHQFVVTATGSGGRVGTAHVDWYVDTTPPTVSLHLAGLTVAGGATVSWQGHDYSGVGGYDLEWTRRSVNGTLAAWSSMPNGANTTSTSTTFAVAPGYVYCVRARASDVVGNYSSWTAPACTMHPVDDSGMRASTGWVFSRPRAAYLQTVHATKALGATMTVSVRHVTALYLLTYVCPSCGSVAVYVGGVRVAALRLVSSTSRWTAIRVLLGGSRSGVVTIRTTSRALVDVDGLGALDG